MSTGSVGRDSKHVKKYEWLIANEILGKETIIELISSHLNKRRITFKDANVFYDICNDYWTKGLSIKELYKKYPKVPKTLLSSFVSHRIHFLYWSFMSDKSNYKLTKVQDILLKNKVSPKNKFGSDAEFDTLRTRYILSEQFFDDTYFSVVENKENIRRSLAYRYFVCGMSLTLVCSCKENTFLFYEFCETRGYFTDETRLEFVTKFSLDNKDDELNELQKLILDSEQGKLNEVNRKIYDKEELIKDLKLEIELLKSDRRLIEKSIKSIKGDTGIN